MPYFPRPTAPTWANTIHADGRGLSVPRHMLSWDRWEDFGPCIKDRRARGGRHSAARMASRSTGVRRKLQFILSYAICVTFFTNILVVVKSGISVEFVTSEFNNILSRVNATDHIEPDDVDEHPPVNVASLNISDDSGFDVPVQAAPLMIKDRYFYQRQDTKVNPFVHQFVIGLAGEHICDDDTEMIIIVHSSPDNVARRDAIRKTWGSVAYGAQWPHNRKLALNVKLAFIFGLHKVPAWNTRLRKENDEVGGIIQGDFIDSYKNMTLKSLLGLKWVVEHCAGVKYLLKSDDDMFINMPFLTTVLETRMTTRTIMGPLCRGSPARRVGKWGVPKTLFPFKYYPPYEAGSAYVITADIIAELFETSEYVPAIFIDDVYITGILGLIIGVRHARQVGFAYAVTRQPRPCQVVVDKVITAHRLQGARLTKFWKEIQLADPARCKKEVNKPSEKKPLQFVMKKRRG